MGARIAARLMSNGIVLYFTREGSQRAETSMFSLPGGLAVISCLCVCLSTHAVFWRTDLTSVTSQATRCVKAWIPLISSSDACEFMSQRAPRKKLYFFLLAGLLADGGSIEALRRRYLGHGDVKRWLKKKHSE